MTFLRSLGAVATASGDGVVDWDAVVAAASAATDPGSLDLDAAERSAFATDVRAARDAIAEVTGLDFSTPRTIEVQHRHHWIEANVATFGRVLAPLETTPTLFPGVASRVNTATMATVLSYLGRNVLGQYDPALFDDGETHLYFVLPNLRVAAETLEVDDDRFRRWIAFHEVTHAAEFGAAPWLVDHLEDRISRAVGALAEGDIDAGAIRDVDAAMTAIEGYAEFVMDRAFDEPADDLRAKLDARRRAGGPIAVVMRRLLGLGLKRRQYERGRRFFDDVAAVGGVAATSRVWRDVESLPASAELDRPSRWLDRVEL